MLTPFQYASNDPITNVDIDGLEGEGSVGQGVGDAGGAARDFSYNYTKVNQFIFPATHAVSAGSAVEKGSTLVLSLASIAIHAVQIGAELNTSFVSANNDAIQAGYHANNNKCCQEIWNNFKNHTAQEFGWIVDGVNQALDNAKKNWQSGHTIPQTIVAGVYQDISHARLSVITGLAGRELEMEELLLSREASILERQAAQMAANKAAGELGESIVTADLNFAKGADEEVFSQVTATFEDGGTTTYDNVVFSHKTGKVSFTNETKTGGSLLSDGQLKGRAGHPTTFGPSAPEQLWGITINSGTTPYKITRLSFLIGEIRVFE